MTLDSSPLGKGSEYPTHYDQTLLFPVARQQGREEIGLSSQLPFQGGDLWYGYELSWLNPKGRPEAACALFTFPVTSPFLIESKSLKLYLNSFNQSLFPSFEAVEQQIKRDLGEAAQAVVGVELVPIEQFHTIPIKQPEGICLDTIDLTIDCYAVKPSLLACEQRWSEEKFYTNLFKSNCPVTGQPDWATVIIHYSGPQLKREALLRYLISFRNHAGFHEQCVERIFIDLMQCGRPEKLTVSAHFLRRGGLDINPFRSNFESMPTPFRFQRQ